jgi:hypothetical protein
MLIRSNRSGVEVLCYASRAEDLRTRPPRPRDGAAALDADVRLTGGHDLGFVWFETHAA